MAKSPTYALYGGSFDPPHLSHVLSAVWAHSACAVARVIVVPAWLHAFDKKPGATYEARLQMCRLAFAGLPFCEISDIERQLGGISRSYDTAQALSDANPEARFRLLIGADLMHETQQWYRWEDLSQLAPPLIVGRQGYPTPDTNPILLPAISSTEIRKGLAQGKDMSNILPKAVAEYVADNELYRSER